MKICPLCKTSYSDDELYFCLNDGEQLSLVSSEPAPTIFADAPRITNQNWNQAQTNSQWQNQQVVRNQQFSPGSLRVGSDQTLPTVALILGILSLLTICCYGGIPFGIAAVITGFLGIKNADSEPAKYGGRGLAIAGIATGAVSFVIAFLLIVAAIFS